MRWLSWLPHKWPGAAPQRAETVRTTIVGGRPPGEGFEARTTRGIEAVVSRAAVDPRFLRRLHSDRDGALRSVASALTETERLVLSAVPDEQLDAMVAAVGPRVSSRRSLLVRLAGVFGALLGASATTVTLSSCSKGERPDEPAPPATKGVRPDEPRPQSAGMSASPPDERRSPPAGGGRAGGGAGNG